MSKNTLFLFSFLLWLCGSVNTVLLGDASGLLKADAYLSKLRPGHPRLFLNEDMLPQIRARTLVQLRSEFEVMQAYVDDLPVEAPVVFTPDPVPRNADGSLKFKAGRQGHHFFKYNGGEQAVAAAFVYLMTGEEKYLAKAKAYLELATYIMEWTAQNGIRVDSTGVVRITALAAYDWIYNDLSPLEREDFAKPLLNYIRESQPEGSYKFRRSIGTVRDGNYGETSLRYFAGLATYGDGIDDDTARGFLKSGAAQFVRMMDFRESISDGSGLLSATTTSYSFGTYPYSTFLFLFSWQAAFGEDISQNWSQMTDYPNWFDFMAIRRGQGRPFQTFGIGDMYHTSNVLSTALMYGHIAQVIHFYSQQEPEKMQRAYAVLAELPPENKVFRSVYSFLPFLATNFDPRMVGEADLSELEYPRYFFNQPFGLLLMRSGKEAGDTYASFRFGAQQGNHQHYDELAFVIYKNGFLALDAGSRTEADHHHGFAPQSVAHNTILIHMENEPLPPFWKAWSHKPDGRTYYNHGGQSDKGKGRSVALRSTDDFVYAAGDATASYVSQKSKEVVRQFVYLKPDLFVVYDRVESVEPSQRKEILVHFINRPKQIAPNVYQADNGGRLFVTTLLPQEPLIHIEGGPGREFWASGRNWPLDDMPARPNFYALAGGWRLEISNSKTARRINFLQLLQAANPDADGRVIPELLNTETEDGLRLTDGSGVRWEILFNRSGDIAVTIRQHGADGTLVFEETIGPGVEGLESM